MPDEGGLDELVGEEQQNIRTMDMGTRSPDTEGLATAMPPTALVIDTAGVRTPSAIVRAVPKSDYTQSRDSDRPLVRPGESTYPYQKREANPVLERYAMGRSCPFLSSCDRTTPIAALEALVKSMNSLLKSGYLKIGVDSRAFFSSLKLSLQYSSYM